MGAFVAIPFMLSRLALTVYLGITVVNAMPGNLVLGDTCKGRGGCPHIVALGPLGDFEKKLTLTLDGNQHNAKLKAKLAELKAALQNIKKEDGDHQEEREERAARVRKLALQTLEKDTAKLENETGKGKKSDMIKKEEKKAANIEAKLSEKAKQQIKMKAESSNEMEAAIEEAG